MPRRRTAGATNAIGALDALTATLPDRCEFRTCQSLYLARRPRDAEKLPAESAARAAAGIRTRVLDRPELRERFGIVRSAALLSTTAAVVDPYRLTHALLRDCPAGSLRVFDRTRVSGVAREGDGFRLATDRGSSVLARQIVYATGYEAQALLKEPIVRLKSTYALATEPIEPLPDWLRDHILWESGTPYFYLRSTPEGRLLLGGADDDFRDPARRDRAVPRKAERVHRYFRGLLPDVDFECALAWAGTFGETRDGLAYFGEPAEMPGVLFALGFGGNGITFGIDLAQMTLDHVEGRTHPAARLFRFGR